VFCIQFAREAFGSIKRTYIDTGRVRWVFRHYTVRAVSERVAQAAECADDQDMFFEYHDALFENFALIPFGDEELKTLAEDLELSTFTFDSCLDDEDKVDAVAEDNDSALALGVVGTPTFFVLNGLREQRYGGFIPADGFGDILDAALGELADEPEVTIPGFGGP
jgi:protein-disulfide isomerase